MIKKILIANRGEIALRIVRACKDLGIKSVAVFSESDKDAMHVKFADESVCIGPPPSVKSYLNIKNIMAAAEVSGAEAIHPGYGFLSENAEFAEIVKKEGLIFIGPSASIIRDMGDKGRAKEVMKQVGIPVVPGDNTPANNIEEALERAKVCGYPAIIKAAAGGGGRGMSIVHSEEEVIEVMPRLQQEAISAFKSGTMIVEKFIQNPRHIELQFLGDQHGNGVCLWERECSLQRRNQKIFEEAPSSVLTEKQREKIVEVTNRALTKIKYVNAGTVEFLYKNEEFYFIEMNTRLQVEHPVTEMITGFDIVKEQILIACGKKIDISQKDIKLNGVSFEARINAEDSETFLPTPGKVDCFHAPGGYGVRMDSFLHNEALISPYYDSMVAKIIVHAPSRQEAILRMKRALEECIIDGPGIKTTIPLLLKLLENEKVQQGNYHINWLEEFLKNKNKNKAK